MSAITLAPSTSFPKGSKDTDPYLSIKETGYGSRRKAVFTFRDCVLPLVDNAGVGGQCCNQLFAFPAEMVVIEGGRVNMTVARETGTTTSLSDTFDGDLGIGTTTGIGNALATTEQDIFNTQTIPQAVAGVATAKLTQGMVIASALVDGTAGTVKGFLNILVDDADQDGSVTPATVKLNGTITLMYTVLGA